jgi:protein ImuB
MRRILCVWLPSFPISRLRRSAAPADVRPDAPWATVESVHGLRILAAVDANAQAAGLSAGQKLAHARAICPGLIIADADPAADRAALAQLARWCERYTPLAAADPPEGLWLDITGADHLFGGEAELVGDLTVRLERNGLPCRIALAGTAGAAWALARYEAGPGRPVILPEGQEQQALDEFPVACLRLDASEIALLRRMGLKTVGAMRRIPRPALSARFGAMPLLRLDQALGAAAEAITWPREPPHWEERLAFAEPVLTPENLMRTLDILAQRLCARLEAKRLGGHRFVATFFRVDDARPVITIGTARPVRDPAYIGKLLKAKLETVDPGFGIEIVSLTAEVVAKLAMSQARLDGASSGDTKLATGVVDTLTNRLGPGQLWRVAPRQSHVPERAVTIMPPLAEKDTAPWVRDPAAPRPLRLLCQPEPIEATALLPDEPPILFRWRGAIHRIRAASGPERIAQEWWHHAPPDENDARPETDRLRDYYRVEDTDGTRFWVFRVGLHGGENPPRWFLHGLSG